MFSQSEIRNDDPIYVHGQGVVSGVPKGDTIPRELKYNVPLSFYEIASYRCSDSSHDLCHKCYDKLRNRSRFGLCAPCFNESNLTTLLASDASERTVYLTRRGRKIQLVGGVIKVPIFVGAKISTYKIMMERPYIIADNPFKKRDFDLILSNERVVKLNAHGKIPMDYLLAELD